MTWRLPNRPSLAACLLPGLLASCAQARVHAEQPAALAANDATSRAVVQSSLQKALGQPVLLGPDALVAAYELVIEPTPARVDGQRIDGRDIQRRSERFTLLRTGDRCLLRRESTGERIALPGASCVAQ
jgi:hypothetical protein